jgi:PRTRC genetic system protein C
MLNVKKLPRVFIYKENNERIELEDINHSLSPEAICNHYANLYVILTTAKIVGPEIRNDRQEFEFVPTIGTKG